MMMMMRGYFDNAASMPVLQEALMHVLPEHGGWANPSSAHFAGSAARRRVDEARSLVASGWQCSSHDVCFTSGATEAANILIQGYLRKLRDEHSSRNEIVVSAIEHPAVYETVKAMAHSGYKIHAVTPDARGRITPEAVAQHLRPRTALVAVMTVNNETGALQPVSEIGRCVKKFDPEIFVLTDAVQYFGKLGDSLDLDVVDAAFMSAHKIGGLQGTGAFYLNPRFELLPLTHGGGHESGRRPGTENVLGIALLGEVMRRRLANCKKDLAHAANLGDSLVDGLNSRGVSFERIVPRQQASPYILALAFPGCRAAELASDLAELGFCVSSGSACSSRSQMPSRVLSAMELEPRLRNGVLRFSFSVDNTEAQVRGLTEALTELLVSCRT
jgi:cysteine desulfurase